MHIGSRLKQILEERNMTVSQLARESGIPAQTLYAMINRDSNKADMDIMAKMLVALDMDFMEFLELESHLEPAPEKTHKEVRQEPARQSSRRELEDYLL